MFVSFNPFVALLSIPAQAIPSHPFLGAAFISPPVSDASEVPPASQQMPGAQTIGR
jgi:hypothetical protein